MTLTKPVSVRARMPCKRAYGSHEASRQQTTAGGLGKLQSDSTSAYPALHVEPSWRARPVREGWSTWDQPDDHPRRPEEISVAAIRCLHTCSRTSTGLGPDIHAHQPST